MATNGLVTVRSGLTLVRSTMFVAIGVWAALGSSANAQTTAPGPTRTVLLQHDTTMPGYENVLVRVELPVGGREGRHTHPGLALVHVLAGALTLEHEGRPTVTYQAGESFSIEAGKAHEGLNKGTIPITAIASFVVEKGKPLATPVK